MSEQRDEMGVVTIGAREIYDAVVGLRADVQSLVQSHEDVAKTLDAHETRIGSLEQQVWRASGVAATLGATAGILIPIIFK